MAFTLNHKSNLTKFIIIGELVVVAYLLYTLTVSVYNSYQIDKVLTQFSKDNEKIALENKKLELDYSYLTSEAYIDKKAKESLDLVNPGEEVIIILPSETDNLGENGENIAESGDDRVKLLSNLERWWNFFFDIPKNSP